MNNSLHIVKFLQITIIIIVTGLYCLAPLQKPLTDGFHKLEHTILNTNSNHSHNLSHELEVSHTHDHQLLSFFNNLFQDNTQGDQQLVKECKLDKHILQYYASEKTSILILSEKNFHYILENYSVFLPYTLPPPKGNFS